MPDKKELREQKRKVLEYREKALKNIHKATLLITGMLAADLASDDTDLEWTNGLTKAGMAFALAGIALQNGPEMVLKAAADAIKDGAMMLGREGDPVIFEVKVKQDEDTPKKGGYL